ncbi:hypothetical protein N7471_003166 [Penicillium samsonianum]|uniref:uncharacterized protein n=1 Tax=Penicillium samsonianum TaxID=1882272 RepID=UPI002546871D|nr:uncharacterized protein N7471_003166 [Penicillium samsonianum]KAJ6143713.1 hypothetical protein N7471_003166 [Penicillium samsonianum]
MISLIASRGRSLTGCSVCRTRHLKCDEARPGCQMCKVLGRPCPGYTSQLKWTQDFFQSGSKHDENSDHVFRRPLFGGRV